MEKVYLVVVSSKNRERHQADEKLSELQQLIYSCGGATVGSQICFLEKPSPNYYLREGKLQEILAYVKTTGTRTILFSVDLSATQTRNLEMFFKRKVIDRTRLILDIFARHAKSSDGKLQVELAQLMYLLPRLSQLWEEFSRLGGGIGTRGPGEQKLEIDRRRISARITKLKKDLERLRAHRALIRKSRERKNFSNLVIVGYTNAGKSQLLNSLSGAEVLVQDKLFATLDPTTRRVNLPGKKALLATDTVGFIENLPEHLMQAFKATLEEIHMADLILHVLDVADPRYERHEKVVRQVLGELGVDFSKVQIVLNKMDLVDSAEERKRLKSIYPEGILVSAKTKEGTQELLGKIAHFLESEKS